MPEYSSALVSVFWCSGGAAEINGSSYGSHGSHRRHRNGVVFAEVIDGVVVAAAGMVVGETTVVAAAAAAVAVGVTVVVVVEGVRVIVEVGQEVRVEVGV